ncbi:DNA mismatch repair endonuclease MutL [Natronobacillus azotifigens]|uniref:DNA mismatch repair protein MutL n=2 Tax=Natronobacillus azotifigens TaxID=472978 RepID=A0A9J6RBD6_9BACI|nr:DNA mismatch repair endonuclease MutL [Natronobacillus azotifigens]MCZ0702636.1 DNA mismatch repair endonuclease MutL [Natronobacillus azotifigens]
MPDLLANKIAAGEVVERPASVVKELIENSIDAGSTSIKLEIEEAGLKRIKITDNGIGMEAEDAERAFLRHATSKISTENDLFHVRTLGFRGEALASIAAVSQLTLKTSTGEGAGTILKLESGKVVERDKSDARQGTEITVDALFYNTPARLKYMKTIHTELGHITDVVNRMALSHANIRFELYHNGKNLFQTSGRGDLLQIIAQVYGVSVAKKMIPVSYQTLDYTVKGYIAKPEVTRASRNYISTIVNGRYIRSIPLNKAISNGYHTLLPIGRHPIVVLAIEMDPILVDVNVHPAKLEVRFSKDKELFQAVEETIRQAFRKETLIPEASQKKETKQESSQSQFSFEYTKEADFVKETQNPPEKTDSNFSDEIVLPSNIDDQLNHFPEMEIKKEMSGEGKQNNYNTDLDVEEEREEEFLDADRIPVMYPIGQHHGTYILAENEEGFYMIDQHAAQERVKYEYFRDKIGEVSNELQELLFPLTFDFSSKEALLIEHYQEELKQVGLFFEHFGQQTYIIRAHPQWFPTGYEEEIIRDIIAQVMENEKIDLAKLREEAAILMSCKRSIKANHYLTKDDMFQLLEDLRKSTDPFTCPHGRPILIHFSGYEIEKMFKRIM